MIHQTVHITGRPGPLVPSLLALVLLVAACTSSGDQTSTDGLGGVESAETTQDRTDSSEPTTTPRPTEGVGSRDDPRSIVNGPFIYTSDVSDTDWSGELYGLIELPLENYSEAEGACYAVIGAISPTRLGEGSISEGFATPDMGLVVDGVLVDEGFDCDAEIVRDAGYGSLIDVRVAEGTEVPFYAAFLVEGNPPPKPTALFLGASGNEESAFFTADVLSAVPIPRSTRGTEVVQDIEPLAGTTFRYRGRFDDTAWNVRLLGVVVGDKDDFTEEAGSCLTLVGSLTPDAIDEGQLSSGFQAPDFSLLAGGVAIDDRGGCDIDVVETAGYGALWQAEVTLGTVYPFRASFFLPEGVPAEAVIVGDPTEDGGARFYSVDVIPTLPPADTSAGLGTVPEGMLPLTGAEFTHTDTFSGTSWEGVIDGLVAIDVDPFHGEDVGRCFAVVGVISPTTIGEGPVTDGFDTPDFGLIASGRSVQWNSFVCDDEQLKANGYQELTDAEIPVGADHLFFVPFFVAGDDTVSLDSVFIRNATEADARYYTAAVLDTIPSRN